MGWGISCGGGGLACGGGVCLTYPTPTLPQVPAVASHLRGVRARGVAPTRATVYFPSVASSVCGGPFAVVEHPGPPCRLHVAGASLCVEGGERRGIEQNWDDSVQAVAHASAGRCPRCWGRIVSDVRRHVGLYARTQAQQRGTGPHPACSLGRTKHAGQWASAVQAVQPVERGRNTQAHAAPAGIKRGCVLVSRTGVRPCGVGGYPSPQSDGARRTHYAIPPRFFAVFRQKVGASRVRIVGVPWGCLRGMRAQRRRERGCDGQETWCVKFS
jgi:hypothetical protein